MTIQMKRIILLLLGALVVASGAYAKRMSELKIYINPGHGGYTSDDRPIRIYPFEQNDTLGYWESKSNLYKGLHMYHILDSLGATPYLSRIKNTQADDRSLSGIAAEANSLGVDLFFSIHSNAGENVNYPLMLYRESTIGTPRYPENITLSKIVWKNLHSRKLAIWTRDTEYVAGDLTFYQNMWQGGLGVLRTLYTVGLLSEGSMHEHRPEAHRLMNDDYNWIEAWLFVKSIMEFYDTEDKFVTGNIAGIIYDDHNLREKLYPSNFTMYGRDKNAPVNGAYVQLIDAQGKTIQTRTTDNMYNGVYAFRNVTPGTYTVRVSRDDYYTEDKTVTVVANDIVYQDFPMMLKREYPLAVTKYAPAPADGELISCSSSIDFEFNTDVDQESFEKAFSITPEVKGYFVFSESYHKASFVPELSLERNTTYTVNVDASAKTADSRYSHPQMEQPLTFTFTTKNRDRLEVIDQFPADGGTVHYATPTLEFRFDNTINTNGVYDVITITDSKGNEVAVNKRTSKFNRLTNGYGNAIFAITGDLVPGEKYHVKLSGTLRDTEALPLGTDIEYDFTAIDATAEAEQTIVEDFETAANFIVDPEQTSGTAANPTATRSTAVKLFDKASGRFTYKFADSHGGAIVWKYTGEPHPYNTNDILGMYINGDFNNHELYVGVASGTNIKYKKVCDLDFIGWQYREVILDNLEKDFCPFLLSEIKVVQQKSPITQNGAFNLDNISFRKGPGSVNDITTDAEASFAVRIDGRRILIADAQVSTTADVYAVDGTLVASKTTDAYGVASIDVPAAGIYIVRVAATATKVSIR